MNPGIHGDMLIGQTAVHGSVGTFRGIDPSTGRELEPAFGAGGAADVERACALAQAAFDGYRDSPLEERAQFLEQIAQNVIDLGPLLIERAMQETGLPQARLEGERGRTVGQLRLFAKVVRDGRWIGATIDSALPERTPPRSDLRLRKIGLGPVAVFGASNFPLAFSVAGGDTASALAAGCPVVVKAHSAHPGTSELVGQAVQAAVARCGLHEGVFSLIFGDGRTVGQALVTHPAIKAVGFTGSRGGGMALVRAAAARPEPIPVYAEMSSINPVFVLDDALARLQKEIASGYVDSLTLGAGQFCTNPGLVFAGEGDALNAFCTTAAAALEAKAASTMLSPAIHAAFTEGVQKLAAAPGVELVARGQEASGPHGGQAALFRTDAATFLGNPALEEENFGASSLVIAYRDFGEIKQIAEALEGQLTATVFMTDRDRAAAAALLPILERKVGRILINGYPTGVEVSHAMVHGGPFPATSDSRTTSVGATAIDRFLRPVCYQDVPSYLLPPALQDGNPLGIWRVKDGELSQA